jgi:hypothetical protein
MVRVEIQISSLYIVVLSHCSMKVKVNQLEVTRPMQISCLFKVLLECSHRSRADDLDMEIDRLRIPVKLAA